MQGNRSLGALRHAAHEGELLPLGAHGEIERELPFDNRIRTALKRERTGEVTRCRMGPGDIADRQQRVLVIRAERLLTDAQRVEVGVQRTGIVAGGEEDIRQIVEDDDQVGMLRADESLPDGQGP